MDRRPQTLTAAIQIDIDNLNKELTSFEADPPMDEGEEKDLAGFKAQHAVALAAMDAAAKMNDGDAGRMLRVYHYSYYGSVRRWRAELDKLAK